MPSKRNLAEFIPQNVKRNKRGCWVWQGKQNGQGYGRIGINYRVYMAHRVVYELYVGPIPKGKELDHLCRNRICVNPSHLEPVTRSVNLLRGVNVGAYHRNKKFCRHGHPFNKKNTYVYPNGWRDCKTCRRDIKKRWVANNLELVRKRAREYQRRKARNALAQL